MGGYELVELGALPDWGSHFGGFTPERSRDGRRIVDHELRLQFFGVSANSMEPGDSAGYWHSHSRLEELYLFLAGEGEMGLGDDVVPVSAGSAVRVEQHLPRTWRCVPSSPGPLVWICIRGEGAPLDRMPSDSMRYPERPEPWRD